MGDYVPPDAPDTPVRDAFDYLAPDAVTAAPTDAEASAEAVSADVPAANQVGSERDPAWVLPEHGVSFTSQAHIDGRRDQSQVLPAHGVEGR